VTEKSRQVKLSRLLRAKQAEFVGPETQELREQVVRLEAERDAWRKLALKLTTSLEYAHIALAVQTDELLAYRDYYGTSPVQVRHLSACHRCESYGQEAPDTTYRCPDYPTE